MDVMLVEAFLDSVKHGNSEPVNDEKQRLKLGAIVLDDCYRLHIASFWPVLVYFIENCLFTPPPHSKIEHF